MTQASNPISATFDILRQAGLRPPKMLTFSITGACNLSCLHCWVEAQAASSSAHVPAATLLKLIGEYRQMGGESIRLTGGEPLCHPAWLELLRFACASGFTTVAMQTNAIMLTADLVTELQKLDFPGLSLQISLDGATAATHDLVRGEGSFAGVLQGLRRLVAAGFAEHIAIFFTEMRHNLQDIPALLELADSLGITSVSTGSLVLCGRAAKESLVAPPGHDQYLELLHLYETDARFHDLYEKIGTTAPVEWLKGDGCRTESCTFVENPYLTPTGKLFPCVLCHADGYAVSGVFEKSLDDAFAEGAPLWSSLLQTSHHRAEAIAECSDCPGQSSCAGGCMGRAWGSSGNLMAADDRCALRRTIYHRKKARHGHDKGHKA